MITLRVLGAAAILDNLKKLGEEMAEKDCKKAIRKAARPIRNTAVSLCPVRTGKLRDSIRVSVKRKGTRVTAKIKAGNKIAYYAPFIEFGHFTRKKKSKVEPHPFMSVAWANQGGMKAINAFTDEMARLFKRHNKIGKIRAR